MAGIFRFALSLLVVLAHLHMGQRAFSHYGVFAVFGFYVISGYLMTTVLQQTYRFRLLPFALNRFLRLFPVYYLVFSLSIMVFCLITERGMFIRRWDGMPGALSLISNVLIVPMAFYSEKFRAIPPAWSVAVELSCYFVLWLFTARSKTTATLTLCAAALYHVLSMFWQQPWVLRYMPVYAAMLPFSMGALIHFHRQTLDRLIEKRWRSLLAITVLAWAANALACGLDDGLASVQVNRYYYTNLIIVALLCAITTCSGLRAKFKVSGKRLGDLAYPIFLCHWLVAFLVAKSLGLGFGSMLFLASLVPILATAYVLARIGERLVEPLRDRVRASAGSATHWHQRKATGYPPVVDASDA